MIILSKFFGHSNWWEKVVTSFENHVILTWLRHQDLLDCSHLSQLLYMYLVANFGNGENGDIKSYISSYLNILEKAKLTTSVIHIDRISKSRIPIYNSKVQTQADRKKRREQRHLQNFRRFTSMSSNIKEDI